NKINEMLGQDYITAKDILNTAQEIAKCLEFVVIIKNSSCCHLHLQCKCGSQPRNTSNLTHVTEIINKHNYPMTKNKRIFHEHHQLMQKTRSAGVQMLKAGASPSMIYKAIRDEDGNPTAIQKDISNLGLQINFLEEIVSIKALIIGLEKREYIMP
ncbi:9720_t:CDS:2, partial [Cetraspora pellucida]